MTKTSRFINNHDGTITDTKTGLMWEQHPSEKMRTWEEAMEYCKILVLAGHKDWRVPKIKEILTLTRNRKKNIATWLNRKGFFTLIDSCYWAAIHNTPGSLYDWQVNFYNGDLFYFGKTGLGLILAVRDGQKKEESNGK